MVDNRNYLIHPKTLALCLLLLGVTSLFLGFTGAYLYARITGGLEPMNLPVLFILNTFLLLLSSYLLVKGMQYYKNDLTEAYKRNLGLTLLITILFLLSQIVAWKQLYNKGVFVDHSNMASYLYIISGVHFAHVIIGIPFLAIFYWKALKTMVEPVSVLIYFTDPDKKRNLKLLTIYWHFLDALWIYLVLFFLLNQLI